MRKNKAVKAPCCAVTGPLSGPITLWVFASRNMIWNMEEQVVRSATGRDEMSSSPYCELRTWRPCQFTATHPQPHTQLKPPISFRLVPVVSCSHSDFSILPSICFPLCGRRGRGGEKANFSSSSSSLSFLSHHLCIHCCVPWTLCRYGSDRWEQFFQVLCFIWHLCRWNDEIRSPQIFLAFFCPSKYTHTLSHWHTHLELQVAMAIWW